MAISPWPVFEQDEIDAVADVLASGRVNYWTGELGKRFEREFAGYCQADHAIAVANGTLALELALEAAGIGAGDDVVVAPRTYIASASAAVRLGARPVFADVDLESQNLTPDSVRAVLTPNTRAVVAVHHAGWPCDMSGLMALADEHDFLVVEDCAQAHGAMVGDRPVGGLGHVAAFSFCQDKIMTTGGEGGMLVTSDEAIWKRAWSIKDHGKNYDKVHAEHHPSGFRWLHDSVGTNMRLTEAQSAIGLLQLGKLPEWHAKRSANAAALREALDSSTVAHVSCPDVPFRHAWYRLYAVIDPTRLKSGWDRNRVMESINDGGVPCFSGSCPELYLEKAFEAAQLAPQARLPNAKVLGERSLAFLIHPTLTDSDLQLCRDVISQSLSQAAA